MPRFLSCLTISVDLADRRQNFAFVSSPHLLVANPGATLIAVIRVGREMEQQLKRAEHYRQQANRYANLAKTAELDFLGEFLRKTAV